jgi:DNA-directed RNA polymerase specialized sigma24 family protein
MKAHELDRLFTAWKQDDSQSNRDALLQAVATQARQQATKHNLGTELDDLINETVLTVLEKADALSADRPFGFWLIRVIKNKLTDTYRSSPNNTLAPLSDGWCVEDRYVCNYSRLAPLFGKNVTIVDDLMDGFTLDEVAARHNTTKKAIQNRINRVRQKQVKNVAKQAG